MASALFESFFLANFGDIVGYISITFVLLASLTDPIKLKCFFHFAGLTKYIGKLNAAHIPLIIPKDCPKLNILVTP